jgi:hypothetical protein
MRTETPGLGMPSTANALSQEAELTLKSRELDVRLRELDIRNKEYEQTHRPRALASSVSNPVVIAAAIAAWASLSAAAITWLSGSIAGNIAVDTQIQSAQLQALADQRKFEANLITESVRTGDPDQAATNLQFLIQAGLLTGDVAKRIQDYLTHRMPGKGRALPPK